MITVSSCGVKLKEVLSSLEKRLKHWTYTRTFVAFFNIHSLLFFHLRCIFSFFWLTKCDVRLCLRWLGRLLWMFNKMKKVFQTGWTLWDPLKQPRPNRTRNTPFHGSVGLSSSCLERFPVTWPYWSERERAIPEARRRGVKMQEVVTRTVYVSSKVAAYWWEESQYIVRMLNACTLHWW